MFYSRQIHVAYVEKHRLCLEWSVHVVQCDKVPHFAFYDIKTKTKNIAITFNLLNVYTVHSLEV